MPGNNFSATEHFLTKMTEIVEELLVTHGVLPPATEISEPPFNLRPLSFEIH